VVLRHQKIYLLLQITVISSQADKTGKTYAFLMKIRFEVNLSRQNGVSLSGRYFISVAANSFLDFGFSPEFIGFSIKKQ
jgi:hypothetical protein